MNLDEMKVSDLKELVQLVKRPKNKETIEKNLGIRIVILQRGWVVVGVYVQKGEYITLSRAAVIRKWGTTNGLPELASTGPLTGTVLDTSPEMRFHILTEVFSISCVEEKWLNKLPV